MSNPVVDTILAQLGGNKFFVMTGATPLSHTDRALEFKINGRHPQHGMINRLRVELAGDDTYTVTVYRFRKLDYRQIDRKPGVFVESLRSTIETLTGLFVSL